MEERDKSSSGTLDPLIEISPKVSGLCATRSKGRHKAPRRNGRFFTDIVIIGKEYLMPILHGEFNANLISRYDFIEKSYLEAVQLEKNFLGNVQGCSGGRGGGIANVYYALVCLNEEVVDEVAV